MKSLAEAQSHECHQGIAVLRCVHDPSAHSEKQPNTDSSAPPYKIETLQLSRCVAICSVGELFGGVERHILGILSGLRAHGIATNLLLFHDGELAAQARQQGVEPVILPSHNRSFLATSRKLAQLLKRQQIRVVHVHGYKATVFCMLARYWYPFGMVKTEHGLPEPTSGRSTLGLYEYLYQLLGNLATRIAGARVCYVTEGLLVHYRQAHSGLRVTVIPNGVANLEKDRLSRPPVFQEDWFNLVMVGRLDSVKGHHLAIEALASESLPPNLHLHIVGIGPCEPALRALAEAFGIAQRVHFLGFRRNVYDYIAYCHTLLMPSLHEGLPYTLLEAMALGTPIIASRVGGLAEVLQNGDTALLVPPANVTSLAQAIARLHDEPELRYKLSEHARHCQQMHYSLQAMTRQYLSIYQEVTADY